MKKEGRGIYMEISLRRIKKKKPQANGKIFDIINERNVKSCSEISPLNHLSGQYPKPTSQTDLEIESLDHGS